MDIHQNARLLPRMRAALAEEILKGRPVRAVAAGYRVSERTARKWVIRFQREGVCGVRDRSSRPSHSPLRTSPDVEPRVEQLRRRRFTGARIAQETGLSRATVFRILKRIGLNRLSRLEPALPVQRYEHAALGDLIHLDIKKLARFARTGHRITGDRTRSTPGAGWEFLTAVVEQARAKGWTSEEHFTVDGTLLEAWASLKSFRPKQGKSGAPPDDPGNPTVNFHGEKRSNQTHESTTDADARLARKGNGKEARLSYNGNLLVENRHGLIVNTELFEANGTAERDAALVMLEQIPGDRRVTVAGDKGYDTRDFVAECRNLKATPHVAQNDKRPGGSAIDARTTRHAGYAVSQRRRKRIEECFGWLKTVALLRKVRHRGIFKVGWVFTFAAAAYNLVRMRNLAKLAVQPA